jgi:hypothetical protein
MTQKGDALNSKTTFARVKLQVNLSQPLEHYLNMLQMINPIHVIYVDIINKDLQELIAPIFKNLYHNSREGASSIL